MPLHPAFNHAPSSDVEDPSSPSLGLPIGMLFQPSPYMSIAFFRQNVILRCQPLPLVAHLVHGIRVLLLRSSLDTGGKYLSLQHG